MEEKKRTREKFIQAQERVVKLRKFYVGLVRLIIFTVLLFLFNGRIIQIFIEHGLDNEHILYWVNWTLWSVPVTIAFIMLIKGLKLFIFKNNSIKNWEDRQIEKIMKEEDSFE
ncbi:2TM domain-containing protein [Maribacter sp.]|uniref:2TM domain-containing protein n=1 Tax=Maribacter sp. TaxID=1897614 RepID=UPI0025C5566D|nr:2TM domain-containing protein [Maribacter sp.]